MPQTFSQFGRRRPSEQGYALLALLAAISISLVLLASALPAIQHATQREQEEEFFWRARQVATAIGSYQLSTNSPLLKLEDLAKPPEVPGKPKARLRPFALVDPLTNSEWLPIRQGDPRVTRFIQTVQAYLLQEQRIVPPQLLTLAPRAVLLPGSSANAAEEKEVKEKEDAVADTLQGGDGRPIIGVVSRSKKKLIRNYYGLETYDQALILTAFCGQLQQGYDCAVLRLPDADKYPGLPLGEALPGQLPSAQNRTPTPRP